MLYQRAVQNYYGEIMKRDMNLIRDILLRISGDDDAESRVADVRERHSAKLDYHNNLVTSKQCGYLSVVDGVYVLSWKGSEFLAMIESDEMWKTITDHATLRRVVVTESIIKVMHDHYAYKKG